MKRALITGNLGLIGGAATKRFLDMGYEVVGIDNNARSAYFGTEEQQPIGHKHLIQMDFDISNVTNVAEFLNARKILSAPPFDVIIHAAAQPSHQLADDKPELDFNVNVVGTHNMLELARVTSPNCTFIYLSTTKVFSDFVNLGAVPYGERFIGQSIDGGINDDLQGSHGIFGAHKLAADIIVQEYAHVYGMDTVVLRPGCITGSAHQGAREHGFLSYLVKCIKEGTPYIVEGTGKQVRDQLHVDDLVDAFVEIVENPIAGAYVIGGGKANSVSVLEAIELVSKKLGKEPNLAYADGRFADHYYNVHDNTAFQEDYPNWGVKHNLTDILEDLIT